MNSWGLGFLELLKYTIPAIVVLIATSIIVRRFLASETRKKQYEMLIQNQEETVRLRLQACERLVLLVERIHPRNLIPRIYQSGMTAGELQAMLLFHIRSEFEHNLSQQIYVQKHVWGAVYNCKEQEMNMINSIARQLPEDASGRELHQKIVDYLTSVDGELPSDVALQLIHEEAKMILQKGALS